MARLIATERPRAMRYGKLTNPGQDFRLLEVLPARGPGDAIVSRLITTSFDKLDSDIVAVSSLLGDSEDTDAIYVDGKAVSLTAHQVQGLKSIRNIFYSGARNNIKSWPLTDSERPKRSKLGLPQRLRHFLRLPEPGLYVWLDSICVNANDVEESSHLKETMQKVYRESKIVTGWLGPAIDATAAGLKALDEIDQAMPQAWGDAGDRELHPENYAPKHKCFDKISYLWKNSDDGTIAFLLPHWVGANDFMHRSYFQRQWILQELFMASNPAFMIGEHIVSWKLVLRINRMLEEFKDNVSDSFPSEFRPAVAELPLGTVYELLEEMVRRKQRLRSVPDQEENGTMFSSQSSEREHDSRQQSDVSGESDSGCPV